MLRGRWRDNRKVRELRGRTIHVGKKYTQQWRRRQKKCNDIFVPGDQWSTGTGRILEFAGTVARVEHTKVVANKGKRTVDRVVVGENFLTGFSLIKKQQNDRRAVSSGAQREINRLIGFRRPFNSLRKYIYSAIPCHGERVKERVSRWLSFCGWLVQGRH